MFCKFCGYQKAEDGAKYCAGCGRAHDEEKPKEVNIADTPKRKSFVFGVLVPGVIVGLVVLVIMVIIDQSSKPSGSSGNPIAQGVQRIAAAARPTPVEISKSSTIAVNANTMTWLPFPIQGNWGSPTISAHFQASGGGRNDIRAYVVDEDGLTNLKNNAQGQAYYNSGQVSAGEFRVTFPNQAANYYVVFDNRFSLFSAKTVVLTGTFSYMPQ